MLPVFSLFPTMFFKVCDLQRIKSQDYEVKGKDKNRYSYTLLK